jgi:hypothetical protein
LHIFVKIVIIDTGEVHPLRTRSVIDRVFSLIGGSWVGAEMFVRQIQCAFVFSILCVSFQFQAAAQQRGCKIEIVTASGSAKFRPFTRARELRGEGAAMQAAKDNWQRDVVTKYGEQWMQFENARTVPLAATNPPDYWRCQPARVGKLGSYTIRCTVNARPCVKGGKEQEDDLKSVLLGRRTVDAEMDSDTINVSQSEEWYRTRGFKALRLEVENNDLRIKGIRLVYLNGHIEEIPIKQRIHAGHDYWHRLRGERKFITQIVIFYDQRNYRVAPVIKIYGERESDRERDRERAELR